MKSSRRRKSPPGWSHSSRKARSARGADRAAARLDPVDGGRRPNSRSRRGTRRAQTAAGASGAEEAGIELASPGGLVLTNKRLLTVQTGEALGLGMGGSVQEVLSAVPISDVDSIKVTASSSGTWSRSPCAARRFKLEANAAAGAKLLAGASASEDRGVSRTAQ